MRSPSHAFTRLRRKPLRHTTKPPVTVRRSKIARLQSSKPGDSGITRVGQACSGHLQRAVQSSAGMFKPQYCSSRVVKHRAACSLGPAIELALQTVPAKRAHRSGKRVHEPTRLVVRQNQRALLSDLPIHRVVIRPLPVQVSRVATQRAPPGPLRLPAAASEEAPAGRGSGQTRKTKPPPMPPPLRIELAPAAYDRTCPPNRPCKACPSAQQTRA